MLKCRIFYINKGYRLVNTRPVAALFGGTFDPPHRGHQAIVDALIARDDIDRILVVPAFLNPFKHASAATPHQRLAWCRTVFDHPRILVDEGEVRSDRPVFTIETYRRLADDFDVRYIVIGSDNLAAIERWRDFKTLNDAVTWLVFEREGYDEGYDKLRRYERLPLDEPVSSTRIRDRNDWDGVDARIVEDVKATLTKGDT
jgi:nicotinate-nucleotide adenylyltransferase